MQSQTVRELSSGDREMKGRLSGTVLELLLTLRYDTIVEFNVDSKAEYTA